ncbi:MAG: hypothetical protein VX044_04850 [Planctomycetota bacterium]|nr:hypothetical protein [Planctomycetota bacterium]
MKVRSPFLALVVALACLFATEAPRAQRRGQDPALRRWQVDVDGHLRSAWIFDPVRAGDDGQPRPVVFVFHGHGGRAQGIARGLAIHRHWPDAITVYPQGLPTPGLFDKEGRGTGWQHDRGDLADRDLRFFDAMLDELLRAGRADPRRVCVTGHSNGGGFCYVLMVARGDQLAAAAPSSASAKQHVGDVALPQIPLLHSGSPRDRVIKWTSQMVAVDRARSARGCRAGKTLKAHPDVVQHPSPKGAVCIFEHDEGHRIPRKQAALTAAFFQRHARPAPPLPPRPLRVKLIQTVRVWDASPHQAFTDLCIDDDQFVLTFREGAGHADGKDGAVRLMRSLDGSSWETMDVLKLDGVDLRDPKVSRMPSGTLHLLMGGSIYDGRKFVSRTTKVTRFDRRRGDSQALVDAAVPVEVAGVDDWIWRVCWHEGAAYGAMYQPAEGLVHLMKSPDGQRFEHVVQWRQNGRPSEATVRPAPDGALVALLRRDGGDKLARIGRAEAPFTEWTWSTLPTPLGGPELLVLPDGRMLAAGRTYGKGGAQTTIGEVRLDGTWRPLLTLPSGGDTSYPGLARVGDRLLMSYYSSHEGKTAVYVAELRLTR